ncbi:16S rRNA (guanine527-N7)-methyltransferase [Solimonas aquatica]|uniref:Ribosomal RNA small subunit methyltransferase G n=1 Tax=Solimonas aquatica TaxID=489703 RepID=A0A1H9J981_9GAMM|nr:16S rRNA (guanine(527)-N(7))-methyltransferase RsmG [Solimonas aquatica]SEQ83347.1 16S rRNA (guanine527-N7)-methyltransferase [Solimonas aquatica]
MSAALQAQLARGLEELGLRLDAEQLAQLLAYQTELGKWNTAYNLTAIRTPSEMVTRHLLDSLALLPLLDEQMPPSGALLDVGAGAGLPGLVLAIARPAWSVTVLDSNGKKARFMRHVQRQLLLNNVQVAECRAEDWQPSAPQDVIVSRAFAALADFFALTRHALAPGGVWVAMKGKLDDAEQAAVPADIEIRESRRLQVPGLREDRHALIASVKT